VSDAILRVGADTAQAEQALGKLVRQLNGMSIQGSKSVDQINKSLGNIEKQAQTVTTSLKTVGAALLAMGAGNVVKGIMAQYLEFEKYQSILTTYLGSQQAANKELERLKTLADTLPQDLADVTQSFLIFTRMGIDTSSKSLVAFSNIATANGKSLTQFAEAVADAMTGEFERLKEFGIKTSKENGKFVGRIGEDIVAVSATATDFTNQLKALGEEGGRFGKAAENNSKTLGQAISNLRGALFSASVTIGEMFKPALVAIANALSNLLSNTTVIAGIIGRLTTYVIAGTIAWVGYKTAVLLAAAANKVMAGGLALVRAGLIKLGIGAIVVLFGELIYQISQAADKLGGWGKMFSLVGAVAREFVDRTINRLTILNNYFRMAGEFIKLGFTEAFIAVTERFVNFTGILAAGFNALFGVFGVQIEAIGTDALASLQGSSSGIREQLQLLSDENTRLADAAKQPWASLAALKEAYQATTPAVEEVNNAQGKVNDSIQQSVVESAEAKKAAKELANQQEKFANTLEGYQTEMIGLLIADKNQRELILAIRKEELMFGRELTDTERQQLTNTLQVTQALREQAALRDIINNATREQTQIEKIQRGQELQRTVGGTNQGGVTSEMAFNRDLAALDAFNKATLVSTEEALRQRAELTRQYNLKIQEIELGRIQQVLMAEKEGAGAVLSEKDRQVLQSIGQNETQRKIVDQRIEFEKKSELQKTQFAISQGAEAFNALGQYNKKAFQAAKALNIAEAIMNTFTGATAALKLPPPFGFIAAAATVATGLAQVATIRAQQYSGRQLGGPVMGGNTYMVGENGPELFTPTTTGSITRNQDLPRGDNVNINFNINTVDSTGFDTLLATRKPMIIQMVRTAMNDKGNRSLV
jgi:hypothetical protein